MNDILIAGSVAVLILVIVFTLAVGLGVVAAKLLDKNGEFDEYW